MSIGWFVRGLKNIALASFPAPTMGRAGPWPFVFLTAGPLLPAGRTVFGPGCSLGLGTWFSPALFDPISAVGDETALLANSGFESVRDVVAHKAKQFVFGEGSILPGA
jgi:hypothetical protein